MRETLISDQEINRKLAERGVADYMRGIGRDGLIRRWKDTVEEVEQGYKFGIYDYFNDLDGRELIEFVGLGGDAEVQTLDHRFKEQLQDTDRRIWRSKYPDAFWIKGYPRNISDEFIEDLEALPR